MSSAATASPRAPPARAPPRGRRTGCGRCARPRRAWRAGRRSGWPRAGPRRAPRAPRARPRAAAAPGPRRARARARAPRGRRRRRPRGRARRRRPRSAARPRIVRARASSAAGGESSKPSRTGASPRVAELGQQRAVAAADLHQRPRPQPRAGAQHHRVVGLRARAERPPAAHPVGLGADRRASSRPCRSRGARSRPRRVPLPRRVAREADDARQPARRPAAGGDRGLLPRVAVLRARARPAACASRSRARRSAPVVITRNALLARAQPQHRDRADAAAGPDLAPEARSRRALAGGRSRTARVKPRNAGLGLSLT